MLVNLLKLLTIYNHHMGFVYLELKELSLLPMGKASNKLTLEAKSITVTCHGFKQAFDVALLTSGNLGVTNVQGHKTSILEQGLNNTYTVKSNLGTGNFSCADGPAAKTQLSEPTGLVASSRTTKSHLLFQ